MTPAAVIVERNVTFGSLDRTRWETIEATIDTGSAHCQVSRSIAERLGAVEEFRQRMVLADGTVAEESVSYLFLALDESLPAVPTTVVIGGEDAPAIVGHIALEQLAVGLDPRTGRLVPELSVLLHQSGWETL